MVLPGRRVAPRVRESAPPCPRPPVIVPRASVRSCELQGETARPLRSYLDCRLYLLAFGSQTAWKKLAEPPQGFWSALSKRQTVAAPELVPRVRTSAANVEVPRDERLYCVPEGARYARFSRVPVCLDDVLDFDAEGQPFPVAPEAPEYRGKGGDGSGECHCVCFCVRWGSRGPPPVVPPGKPGPPGPPPPPPAPPGAPRGPTTPGGEPPPPPPTPEPELPDGPTTPGETPAPPVTVTVGAPRPERPRPAPVSVPVVIPSAIGPEFAVPPYPGVQGLTTRDTVTTAWPERVPPSHPSVSSGEAEATDVRMTLESGVPTGRSLPPTGGGTGRPGTRVEQLGEYRGGTAAAVPGRRFARSNHSPEGAKPSKTDSAPPDKAAFASAVPPPAARSIGSKAVDVARSAAGTSASSARALAPRTQESAWDGQPGEFPPLPRVGGGLRDLPARGFASLPSTESPRRTQGVGETSGRALDEAGSRPEAPRIAAPRSERASAETQGLALVRPHEQVAVAPFGTGAAQVAVSLGFTSRVTVQADVAGTRVAAAPPRTKSAAARLVAAALALRTGHRRALDARKASHHADLAYRQHQRNLARARDAARGAEAKGEHRRAARIRSKAERTSAAGARARAERRRSSRALEQEIDTMREARRRWHDAAAELDRSATGADAWATAAGELERVKSR